MSHVEYVKRLVMATNLTTSGVVQGIDQSDLTTFTCARFCLMSSAVSGTSPTLDIEMWGICETGKYHIFTFPQLTEAGGTSEVLLKVNHHLEFRYTIGGTTPSFTFMVEARY